MIISFSELREIKHALPTGSVHKIAEQLNISEQTVRNYFGAKKYEEGGIAGKHVQQGPNGGYVELEDTRILELAREMISSQQVPK
ncbi:MAG: helix-turn-helix domain-containing protein [Phaeodactylibacter sp.]|nr:helix-turn-helix domain-containing protein [Phaeodactylibacter sp.]